MMFLLFAMTANARASGLSAPPKRVKLSVNTPDNGFNYPNAMATFSLQPGDIIEVPAGSYAYLNLGNITGTAASPIQLVNSGGQVRLGVNNKTSAGSSVLAISTCSFLEISGSGTPGVEFGFDIDGRSTGGGTLFGIYLGQGSTDVDVHHIYIHDALNFIIAKTTPTTSNPQWHDGAFVMKNVKLHDIKGRNSTDEGFYVGNSNYFYPGTTLRGHWMEGLLIYNNDLENMMKDGIQTSLVRGPGNKIYNNRVVGYGKERNVAHGYGILAGGGTTLEIYNNVVTDGFYPAITLFGSGRQKVYNNLIRNIELEGISVYDKLPSGIEPGTLEPVVAEIYNNTIINTDLNRDAIKIFAYLTTVPHLLYNNVMVVNGVDSDAPERGIYAKGAQTVLTLNSNNMQVSNIDAAGFVSASTNDYHLTAASPAVDKGRDLLQLTFDLDGYARPNNGKYDIGAYEYRSTPPNVAPAANAGGDQTVQLPATTATLDGSASRDSDGTIASYKWAKVTGPAGGNLSDAAAIKPVISALQAGTYLFELTITDNLGATGKDQVTITVTEAANQLPTANAGADQSVVLPLSSTTLDGSASKDNDGTLTYAWSKISGPAGGNFTDATAIKPIVTGLQAGAYVFQLKVTDNKGATATDQMTVTVTDPPNQLPTANAGADQSVVLPLSSTTLDGSASKDNDGTLTYAWSKISGPAGGNFTDATAIKPIVTGLQAGAYVFQLKVTDNKGATATDQMTVTVSEAGNQPPTANAGPDQTIASPVSAATLDGSASKDNDGTLTYAWTTVSGPAGGTFNDATAIRPVVSGLIPGTYVFQLTVTDNKGATAADQVTITVTGTANQPPVANAGAGQTIVQPASSTTLDGSGSRDADGTITYAWTKVSGPAGGTFNDATAVKPVVSGLQAGTYIFQLTVIDNKGAAASDQVSVTVQTAAAGKPVANAGTDQEFNLPKNTATLDGSASSDAQSRIATYRWQKLTGPDVKFSNASAAVQQASQLVEGVYVFQLTVTNEAGQSATATTKVTVLPVPNKAPVAVQGNFTLELPVSTIEVDAGGSFDEDGTVTAYAWEQTSGPRSALIWNKQSVKTAISNLLLPGDYLFRLTVTDNRGATGFKDFTIIVLQDKQTTQEAPLIIFPNPVTDMLHLSIQMPRGESRLQLQFFNLQGVQVGADQVNGEGRVRKDINVRELPAGIFFMKITGSQGYSHTHRFVKATGMGN